MGYASRELTSLATPLPYTDNQWHHVVAVRDAASNALHLYIDGNLVATTIFSGSNEIITSATAVLAIGAAVDWNGDRSYRSRNYSKNGTGYVGGTYRTSTNIVDCFPMLS